MGRTSIEWCDQSWPVVNGCRRISPGCQRCYAERLAASRLSKTPKYRGLAIYGQNGPHWTGETRLWVKDLDMPLRLREPARIFVADMGDLFYEQVTNEEIAAVFGVMAAAPQHTFQVLTKRARRMREWFEWVASHEEEHGPPPDDVVAVAASNYIDCDRVQRPWPLPNVWLGVSVENQQYADERIPELLRTPAAVRFVSYEPALDLVDFNRACWGEGKPRPPLEIQARQLAPPGQEGWGAGFAPLRALDWLIVGGESGPGARPFDETWARETVRQCRQADVPVFVKQMGSNAWMPSSGKWVTRYNGHIEFVYAGRDAATVYPNCVWHTWDRNGIGGYNANSPDVATAKSVALRALADQHIHPIKGWASHPRVLKDRKGADMTEWPEDLRVREFPEERNGRHR
jgi:protein gp37